MLSNQVKYEGVVDVQVVKGNKVVVIAPGVRLEQLVGAGEVWDLHIAPKGQEPELVVTAADMQARPAPASVPARASRRERQVPAAVELVVDGKQAEAYGRAVITKRPGQHVRVEVPVEAALSFKANGQVGQVIVAGDRRPDAAQQPEAVAGDEVVFHLERAESQLDTVEADD